MKRINFLILLVISNFLYSQNKQFIYEYKYIPDSTNVKNILTEMMILNVEKEKSEYYGFEKFESDSTLLADSKKGIFSMPPNKMLINHRVIKFPNSTDLKYITIVGFSKYNVSQKVHFDWKLHPEFSKILNLTVQKASTNFGGRKWIAWFAKEIPIQDGPYKFKGLPGLIVKLEDEEKNHSFELKGIKSKKEKFVYPEVRNYSQELTLNFPQYLKAYKNYRKSPDQELIGQYPDQTDSEGNFKTGEQIRREVEEALLERINKDNNIIEIQQLR